MAHEIERLPGPGGRKQFREYDWKSWFNGSVWTLERGKDFDVEVTAMRTYVYKAARIEKVRVRTVRTPGKLHIKAIGALSE